jgi:hypothetical protein
VASRQTKPFATTVTVCRAPWYSRTSRVPGLRRLGRSARDLSPRARLVRCFAVCGSRPPNACSWRCQERNRAMRSLVKAGGGDVRSVARHRLRSSSRPSDRMRPISASIASPSNEERSMAVRQRCVLTDFFSLVRHPSPRCGRCALRQVFRTRVSGRVFAHHAGKEAADRMGLPAGRLHDRGDRCSLGLSEQGKYGFLLRPAAGRSRGPILRGRRPFRAAFGARRSGLCGGFAVRHIKILLGGNGTQRRHHPSPAVAPSPAGQDPEGAKTGPSLGTVTVTLSSPQKSTSFCEENRRDVLTLNQEVADSIPPRSQIKSNG